MMTGETERNWIQGLIRKYYSMNQISLPYDPARKEFGCGWDKKINTRHLGFDNEKEFNYYLQNKTPLYISASVGDFLKPSFQPMSRKGLLGADLIYEFDADDFQTPCKEEHDRWKCGHCYTEGKGHVLKCTNCGKGTNVEEWVCEKCLKEAKVQTKKLVAVLLDDFGFEKEEIFLNFSGGKGYHIHVRSKKTFELSKEARVELMDYLSWHDFDPALHGFVFDGKLFHAPLLSNAKGNTKRLLEKVMEHVEKADETDWAVLSGTAPRIIRNWLENKEQLLSELSSGIMPALPGKKTEKFWNTVLANLAEELKSPFDRQTSGDIHKLIRIPDTIHGSTGLLAKTISLEGLDSFDPLADTAAFSSDSKRKVFVSRSPKIRIGLEVLEPIENEEKELPASLAVYLIGNGAAELR
jgi:DNA primase small subunit